MDAGPPCPSVISVTVRRATLQLAVQIHKQILRVPAARGAFGVPDGAARARERGVDAGIARFAGRPRGVGSVVRGRAIG